MLYFHRTDNSANRVLTLATESMTFDVSGTPVSSPSSFELARTQSFGFFDNIPNEDWIRAQEIHAQMFPNYDASQSRYDHSNTINDKGKTHKLRNGHVWYGNNYQEEFHCGMAQRIRPTNEADGPKWVCDPNRIGGRRRGGKNQEDKEDCLVYSFGSNGKAEFEQGVKVSYCS